MIKKNINPNTYQASNPVIESSQAQTQNQAQQQQQALIKMQNKAQILYQSQSNNRTEQKMSQN